MPVYDFNIRRSGNLAVACSVPWALEGTGAEPITGSWFQGGVLPSGIASFAAGQELSPQTINLLAGTRPPDRRDGRLILRAPTGCRIDPFADQHSVFIPSDGTTPPPPPPPPPGGLWEPIPLASLPDSQRTDVSSGGTHTGSPGQNFVLTSPLTGAVITLRGNGSKDREIVFRGNHDASDAAGLRVLQNCTVNLEGDYCCLSGFVLRNTRVFIKGANCRIARCEFTDWSPTTRQTSLIEISEIGGSGASVHKNDFTSRVAPFRGTVCWDLRAPNCTFAWNCFDTCTLGAFSDHTYLFFLGESHTTSTIQLRWIFRNNLLVDCNLSDIFEAKVSDITVQDNTVENCQASGFRTRHGERHAYHRNLFIRASNTGLITIRSGPHELTENQSWTQGGSPGGGKIWLFAGTLPWPYDQWIKLRKPGGGTNWMAAGNCTVVGNLMGIDVGHASSSNDSYAATDCNVGPTSGPSRNGSITLMRQTGTKRNAVSGYDIDRDLPWLKRSDTGLRAP